MRVSERRKRGRVGIPTWSADSAPGTWTLKWATASASSSGWSSLRWLCCRHINRHNQKLISLVSIDWPQQFWQRGLEILAWNRSRDNKSWIAKICIPFISNEPWTLFWSALQFIISTLEWCLLFVACGSIGRQQIYGLFSYGLRWSNIQFISLTLEWCLPFVGQWGAIEY